MRAEPSSSLARVPLEWSRFRYPQSLYKYGALLGALAFIAFSLDYLDIPLERLLGMPGRMFVEQIDHRSGSIMSGPFYGRLPPGTIRPCPDICSGNPDEKSWFFPLCPGRGTRPGRSLTDRHPLIDAAAGK